MWLLDDIALPNLCLCVKMYDGEEVLVLFSGWG